MRFSQLCNTRVNPIMIGNQGFSKLLQFCRLFVHFLQISYLVKFFDKVFTILFAIKFICYTCINTLRSRIILKSAKRENFVTSTF